MTGEFRDRFIRAMRDRYEQANRERDHTPKLLFLRRRRLRKLAGTLAEHIERMEALGKETGSE